ncbi:hypothetical protein K503DRAFT_34068 [Rhizopogon vinicolor AM-OR11-026]|uniref:Uncharacterized protein n=1 Tax=Rhizopogon vinicolor AM-OR11-026 TaxID=1314800 RepID=A0A1B7MH40_9AGAM|nr:hypothetical protein K503DRAFT_34068 [Rhizopogon vinicolor AM-OR11-026]
MPPTIEKLQETWTSSSITTLFRLCSAADIASSLSLQSPIAGFSWSLTLRPHTSPQPPCSQGYPGCRGLMKHGNKISPGDESDESGLCTIACGPLMYRLFFDSSDYYGLWRGEQVDVTLSFSSHSDGDINASFPVPALTTLVLGCNLHPLVTYSAVMLGDALLSLEVAFTSLPTRNLFRESNVPQARTVLRALEQSLKTGTSFDIIFQAYTRCISPGKVTRPIPIYANTTVLQATTLLPDFGTFYSCSS